MINVLCVDDSPSLLHIMKQFLEKSGEFTVDTAPSARTALQNMRTKCYDAVVSDFQMPEISGLEFLSIVRKEHPFLPFIIFTGKGREDVVIEAFEKGADSYVQKGGAPVPQFAELSQKIIQAVERNQIKEKLRESEEKYRHIVETTPDMIWEIDPEGIFTYISPQSKSVLGFPPGEIIGTSIFSLVKPESIARITSILRSHQHDSESFYQFEVPTYHRDGSPKILEIRSVRVTVNDNQLKGFLGIAKDITERKREEDVLRQSYERFTQIAENVGEWIWEVDGEGTYSYVSPNVGTILGYSPEEIVGKMHFYDFFEPNNREELKSAAFEVFNRKEPFKGFINANVKKDGNLVILETCGVPILDAQGVLIGYRGADLDITERRKMEDSLQESESKYRTVFENTGTATVILDQDTTIRLVNEEFVRLTEFTREELEGKKSWTEFVVKEDLDRMLFQHNLRRTQPGSALRRYEFRLITKTGCIRNILLSIDLIPSTSQSIASLTDITERKEIEQQLIESEKRYHDVVEDQTEFICRFRPDGTHIFVNEAYCKYFNKKREDIVGKRMIPRIPKEDQTLIKEHFESLTIEHPVSDIRHRIIMPDGQVRWQRWVDRAIYDPDGNLIEFQSVGRDITRQVLTENALSEANQKLQLLSNVTRHDILNQLMALNGYIELSRMNLHDPLQLAKYIEKESKIVSTIEDQIRFTRDYQNMGVKAPVWQSLIECIDRVKTVISTKNVLLEFDSDDYEVFADPLFERVFYNLLDNSVRHGGDQMTKIHISSFNSEKGLVITYDDNGIGIPPEDQERLFKRGFGRNTGLGLFLVREILSITGMMITATSQSKGAHFEITVPAGVFRLSAASARISQ